MLKGFAVLGLRRTVYQAVFNIAAISRYTIISLPISGIIARLLRICAFH